MAKENTSNQQSTTASKPKLVCCLNCLHAALHRYGNNPILAACHKKPQENNDRFPYQVEVACHLRRCSYWELEPVRKSVEIREKALAV